MDWLMRGVVCCLTIACVAGCANVKVDKVPVGARVAGADGDIEGFRYYLSRPYIVVGRRVPVVTTYAPAALAHLKDASHSDYVLVALVPDTNGRYLVFNREGIEIGELPMVGLQYVPASGSSMVNAPTGNSLPPGLPQENTIIRTIAVRVAALTGVEPANQSSISSQVEAVYNSAFKNPKTPVAPTLGLVNGQLAKMVDSAVKAAATARQPAIVGPPPLLSKESELVSDAQAIITATSAGGPASFASWQVILAKGIALRVYDLLLAKNPGIGNDTHLKENLEAAAIAYLGTNLPSADSDVINLAKKGLSEYLQNSLPAGSVPNKTEALALVSDSVKTLNGDYAGVAPSAPPKTSSGAALTTLAAAPAASGTPAQTDTPTTAATQSQTAAPDTFQVMFLPDFEEQYAIRNKNCLAKTKYDYVFRNGTELAAFSGTYNATDVPVQILETVGTLIQAAGEVAKTAIANPPGAAATGAKLALGAPDATLEEFYVKIEYYIEPGVYRIQKSWERAAATAEGMTRCDQFVGLFGDIGFSISTVHAVLTPKQYSDETTPAKTPSPTPSK